LMALDQFLDGFVPYIRSAAEEHEGSGAGAGGGKGRPEGGLGGSQQVRFGCMWDLVMLWDEVDMEVVRPKKKLEKEPFVNAAAGINVDKYDEVEVRVEGDNAPPPWTSVRQLTHSPHLYLDFNFVFCG